LTFLLIILIKTIQGNKETDRTFTKHDKKANDFMHNLTMYISILGYAVAQMVEVAIGIFPLHNPSGRTMALGSTQPLTEMSTRYISCGVKAADA
jgi:hypothetical protein